MLTGEKDNQVLSYVSACSSLPRCDTNLERSNHCPCGASSRGNRKFKSSVYFAFVEMIVVLKKILSLTQYMTSNATRVTLGKTSNVSALVLDEESCATPSSIHH